MTLETLKTSEYFWRIPDEGIMIAVFEDSVRLERYRKEKDGLRFPDMESGWQKSLLRLHCFDRNTEYRLLVTDDGERKIEVVLNAEEEKEIEPDLLFEDEMLLRPEYRTDRVGIQKLKVINRYCWTPFDTMTLDNYRISAM